MGVGNRAVKRVALAIALLACRKEPAAPADEEGSAAPVAVTCEAARAVATTARIDVRGVVGVPPDRGATVASTVVGRIAELRVHEGQRVAKGAPLATIDDPSLGPAVAEGDAAVSAAQAAVANAEAVLARANRLVAQGVAPRRDAEEAEARRATTAADLATARAKQGLARRQLDRAHVVAPIAGVVVHLFRHVGELVDGTPTTPLAEIADSTTLELHADVPAADLVRMRVDQHAEVILDALPDQHLVATITAISPAVTTATALGQVRATLAPAPPDVQLVLGLAGALRIDVPRAAGGVSVPVAALRRAADGTSQVVSCKGGVAHPLAVTPGGRVGDRVEIASGLAVGETVVIDHVLGLEEGVALKVAK